MRRRFVLPPAAVLLPLAACAAPPETRGQAPFREICTHCDGPTGAGNGPMAAALSISPANLRTLAARNGGTFPRERVMATIYGHTGKDDSALMPSFGTILDGPQINRAAPDGQAVPTPEARLALAGYLQTLQDS